MQGSDTSVLVPQATTSGKFTTGRRASSGVVWRAWPDRPQLAARAVSPTSSTSGLSRPRQDAPWAASRPIGSRGRAAPRASEPATLASDHARLAGVIR